jgi:hypothetical protein
MSQPPQQQQPYQGRGGGRGGYQPAPYGPGRGVARPAMGAWQPAQPSTGLPPPQQQQPPPQQAPYGGRGGGRGGYQPGGRGNYNAGGRGNYNPGRGGYQQPQQPPQQAQAYYNPYQQPQPPYGGRGAGGWQKQASYTPAPYGGGGRGGGGGGVYYPPPQQQQQQQPAPPAANGGGAPAVVVPKPRPKKVLVITDKDGNVIDLSAIGKKKEQPPTPVTPPTPPSDAGAKMRQAALAKIQEKDGAEKAQKEEALAQKKEADEQEAAAVARKKKADEEAKAEAAAKEEAEAAAKEEAEAAAKVQEEAAAKKAAAEEAVKATPVPVAKPKPSTSGRIVLTKELLLRYVLGNERNEWKEGCHAMEPSLSRVTISCLLPFSHPLLVLSP